MQSSTTGFGGFLGSRRLEASETVEEGPFGPVIRQLQKKDWKTRFKALRKLALMARHASGEKVESSEDLQGATVEALLAALASWSRAYSRLQRARESEVRVASHAAMAEVALAVGNKGMMKHASDLLPLIWFARCDEAREVAHAAEEALLRAFPSEEKIRASAVYTLPHLIKLVGMRLDPLQAEQWAKGDEKEVDIDGVSEMLERTYSQALRTLAWVVTDASAAPKDDAASGKHSRSRQVSILLDTAVNSALHEEHLLQLLDALVEELSIKGILWGKMLGHTSPAVRKSCYQVDTAVLLKRREIFISHKQEIAVAIFEAFADEDVNLRVQVWEMALSFVKRYPEAFQAHNIGALFVDLFAFVDRGCEGLEEVSYPSLTILLQLLPLDVLTSASFMDDFLGHIWSGGRLANSLYPAMQCISDCIVYILRVHDSQAVILPVARLEKMLDNIICKHMLHDVLSGSARAQAIVVRLIGQIIALLNSECSSELLDWFWERVRTVILFALRDSEQKGGFLEIADTVVSLTETLHTFDLADYVIPNIVQPSAKLFLQVASKDGHDVGVQYLVALVRKYGGATTFDLKNSKDWDQLVEGTLLPWCDKLYELEKPDCLGCKYLVELLIYLADDENLGRSWLNLIDAVSMHCTQDPVDAKHTKFVSTIFQGLVVARSREHLEPYTSATKGISSAMLHQYLQLLQLTEGKLSDEQVALLCGLLGASTVEEGTFSQPLLPVQGTCTMLSLLNDMLRSDNVQQATLALQVVSVVAFSPFLVHFEQTRYIHAGVYLVGRLLADHGNSSSMVRKRAQRIWGTGDMILQCYKSSSGNSLIELLFLLVDEIKRCVLSGLTDVSKLVFELLLLLETWKTAPLYNGDTEIVPLMVDRLLLPIEGVWPQYVSEEELGMMDKANPHTKCEYSCFCKFTARWLLELLSNGANVRAFAKGNERSWVLTEVLCAASHGMIEDEYATQLANNFVAGSEIFELESAIATCLMTLWKKVCAYTAQTREMFVAAILVLLNVLVLHKRDSTICSFFVGELVSETSPGAHLKEILTIVSAVLRQSQHFETSGLAEFSCKMINFAKSAIANDSFIGTAVENVLACFPVSQNVYQEWMHEEREAEALIDLARLLYPQQELEYSLGERSLVGGAITDDLTMARIMQCCLAYSPDEFDEHDWNFIIFVVMHGVCSLHAGMEDVVDKIAAGCPEADNLAAELRQIIGDYRQINSSFEFCSIDILAALCRLSETSQSSVFKDNSDSPFTFVKCLQAAVGLVLGWGLIEAALDDREAYKLDATCSLYPENVWRALAVVLEHVRREFITYEDVTIQAWNALLLHSKFPDVGFSDAALCIGFSECLSRDLCLSMLKLLFERDMLRQVFSRLCSDLEEKDKKVAVEECKIKHQDTKHSPVPYVLHMHLSRKEESTVLSFAAWALLLSSLRILQQDSTQVESFVAYAAETAFTSGILGHIEEHMWIGDLSMDKDFMPNSSNKSTSVSPRDVGVFLDRVQSLIGETDPLYLSMLARILFWGFLLLLPSQIRSWFLSLRDRQRAQLLESYASTTISPLLIDLELNIVREKISSEQMQSDNVGLEVKAIASSRAIHATFSVDESKMELDIRLPECFPLKAPEVYCIQNVGVSESTLRKWLLQVTSFLKGSRGSIYDSLLLWKENVERQFEGIEECPICYSIVHCSNRSLPRLACQTCKHKFHSACLFKWFNTSHKSNCPLCQSPF